MNRIFKYIIAITLIVIIGVFASRVHRARIYNEGAGRVYLMLSRYIQDNNGQFPKSQDQLINKGYLRTETIEGKTEYQYLKDVDYPDSWATILNFNKYTIDYGVILLEQEIKDRKLYDRKSQKHSVLIDGPKVYPILTNNDYDYYSVRLYKKAIEAMDNIQIKNNQTK